MRRIARRRALGLAALVTLCSLGGLIYVLLEISIRSTARATGWLLLGLVALLALFNARKKLPFLQLGSATAWLEFHVYAGVFALAVFVAHIGFEAPNGPLELTLALAFVLAWGSGVLGLLLSRWFPMRLTTRGEAILFERIPALRAELLEATQDLVLRSAREGQTTAIADFYGVRLAEFFRGPKNLWFHLLDSPRPYRNLARELDSLGRYANTEERELLAQIGERVRQKDDLDYQWSQQIALRAWLFVHVPVTYAMLILIFVHVLLAYGFDGGFRT
jgi:hypothetical protein